MALKKTKTIGKGSASFLREFDHSEFTLDEEREKDLKFLLSQPKKGEKVLNYFLRTGLKYKEVFDAINIGELPASQQKQHLKNIAAALREIGWQGKIDLHTRPMGVYDHPSPHFHLWGSQVIKEVYEVVKNYLIVNELTYPDRLKAMKAAKVINKISREDVKNAKDQVQPEPASAEPTELLVRRRQNVAGKRLEEFVDKFKHTDPETAATVQRISEKTSQIRQKIDAFKKTISREDAPIVKMSDTKHKAVDNTFENSAKALRDRIQQLKTSLSTNT